MLNTQDSSIASLIDVTSDPMGVIIYNSELQTHEDSQIECPEILSFPQFKTKHQFLERLMLFFSLEGLQSEMS